MSLGRDLLFLLVLYHTALALELIVPPKHQAQVGSSARIPCQYKVDRFPVELRFFAVHWRREGKNILSYDDIITKSDPRYSLDTENVLYGVADLTISSISAFDDGDYTCLVIYSPVKLEKEIKLDIQAPPRIMITKKDIVANTESVLHSSITGFFPMDIEIKWFKGKEELSMVTLDKIVRHQDGTYSVKTSVTIIPTEEDRKKTFSCRVQHQSLRAPLQSDFQLVYKDAGDYFITMIIITCACALVALGVLFVILWCALRKRNKARRDEESHHREKSKDAQEKKSLLGNNSAVKTAKKFQMPSGNEPFPTIKDIEVGKLVLGETGILTLDMRGYIEEVHTVTWFRETPDGEIIRLSKSEIQIDESSKYETIHRACLMLDPVQESDQGAKFICKVDNRGFKKSMERKTEPVQVINLAQTPKKQNASIIVHQSPKNPSSEQDNEVPTSPEHDIPETAAVQAPEHIQCDNHPEEGEENLRSVTPVNESLGQNETPNTVTENNPITSLETEDGQ